MEAGLCRQTKLGACFSCQGVSRAISTSGLTQPNSSAPAAFQTQSGTIPSSDTAQLQSCTLCLVSPTAATATNTVLCHCRDNGDREPQHCLPSWEGAQTAADLGGGCCFDSILQLTKMPQRKRKKTQTCKTYTYLTSQEKYGQSIPGKQTRMAVCDRPRLSVTPFYSHTK